jgi:hypothetical protein
MLRVIKRLPWIAAGGAAVWFLDPERGAERRRDVQRRLKELTNRPELPQDPSFQDVTTEAA